jgi:hypothetical protein
MADENDRNDEDDFEDEDEDEDEDDEEDEEDMDSDRGGFGVAGFAVGLALGAVLGASVALLMAPAAGDVTRHRLQRRLRHARHIAEEKWDDLADRARKEVKKVRST